MLAVPFSVSGQEAPIRPDCQEMMSKADALLVKPQPPLKEALRLYLSAQNCDNRLSSQVSRKIEDIFDRIEQQRKNEAAARQEAFRQTRKAEIETIRATGAALSATARQKYTEDHTIALNLAIHSYQLSPTPENADAIRDFLQDSSGNSIFYQNFLGDSDYIHHLPMGQLIIPITWGPFPGRRMERNLYPDLLTVRLLYGKLNRESPCANCLDTETGCCPWPGRPMAILS